MSWAAFTPLQTVLMALLPKRAGALNTATLSTEAGVSLPTIHAELRPLIESGHVVYDGKLDQYSCAGAKV